VAYYGIILVYIEKLIVACLGKGTVPRAGGVPCAFFRKRRTSVWVQRMAGGGTMGEKRVESTCGKK
jgi:hypothetical protein